MSDILLEEYIARINRVLDYIDTHLSEEMTLEELASVACFSKSHFHRVFQGVVGETLFQFIQRLRIEKAAQMLQAKKRMSVTEIFYECGFTNHAAFSRAFKQSFGMSPSAWRALAIDKSNISTTLSNDCIQQRSYSKAHALLHDYTSFSGRTQKGSDAMQAVQGKVRVQEWKDTTVAYVRHIGPYVGDSALFETLFKKICGWAGTRGLLNKDTEFLVIYHDDLAITDEDKLRISVCVTVPDNTEVSGEIGKTVIPKGTYAMARFTIKSSEFSEAWQWVYSTWLPSSGYQSGDNPCFELYPGEPNEDGSMEVDICISVKPM